jgi:hypothetical protein
MGMAEWWSDVLLAAQNSKTPLFQNSSSECTIFFLSSFVPIK